MIAKVEKEKDFDKQLNDADDIHVKLIFPNPVKIIVAQFNNRTVLSMSLTNKDYKNLVKTLNTYKGNDK